MTHDFEYTPEVEVLTDEELLTLAKDGRKSEIYIDIMTALPANINPVYIIGDAIELAYNRDLIDEQEHDWYRRQAGL